MKFTVEVVATDWCGYDSHYEIEADHQDEAEAKAHEEFLAEWDLIAFEGGRYGEHEDFDEDGYPHDEDDLTSITSRIQED